MNEFSQSVHALFATPVSSDRRAIGTQKSIDRPEPNLFTDTLICWVSQVKGWHACLAMVAYFGAVCWLDYLTGDELILALLYLPVVAFVSVRVSLKAATNLSLACSFIWLVDDAWGEWSMPSHHQLLAGCIHFMCFTVMATVVARLNVALQHEHYHGHHDYLTGLPNMSKFRLYADKVFALSRRDGSPVSMLFLDCDNFKTVNDSMGHDAGDQVLQAVADVLRAHTRKQDQVARYGGDEFVAIQPATSIEEARLVTTRLHEKLLQRMQARGWPVTFSIGLVTFNTAPEDVELAIKSADELMYACKKKSKNGVVAKQIDCLQKQPALVH